jgi:DNA-binding beta-propeller fold protein YncE
MRIRPIALLLALSVLAGAPVGAGYTNYESSQVHPIALTPGGARLLVVNTPDAVLEVFAVSPGGDLTHERSIPVGLEPVSVVPRTAGEAWVVNRLSDDVSVVDLGAGVTVRSLRTGDEPADVAFAAGKAFVTVSGEHAVKVFNLADLDAAPQTVPIFGVKPRALAVSPDGASVYATVLFSGNQTTVVTSLVIQANQSDLDPTRLTQLGLNDLECDGPPPAYPPLPTGIQRNPDLTDPPSNFNPPVALIVKWNEAAGQWQDDAGQNWNACLPYRLADHDLFVIDSATLAVTEVDHLGTTLFDVSVNPDPEDGRIYVPHTESRNQVRFEHPLGVQGHVVDNRMAIVDPADGFATTLVDLNTHINRGSDPATNLAERQASVSQPGMMVWNQAGTLAYLTAIGSRKLFRIDGACEAGGCIFGPDRTVPAAVEVGEGPTGVALNESADRLYVLNRFTNTIALVAASTMTKLGEVPLHDPSPVEVKEGRRFLYDSILGSGHGDAACSSCHISGDRDDLGWDLGDPTGEMVPYATEMDNVRFILPANNQPVNCDASLCASHDGFDPQKGPMTTQTLRGMLEPLHWRGDRATMNDFNPAFVGLMGTADIGPINGKPAGLSAQDMERFRQFALGIRFPPNPLRNLDDSLPDAEIPVPGTALAGNPVLGETIFDSAPVDAGQPCRSCHTHPFGAAGGKLGGVTPEQPTSNDAAALFNGNADKSAHSDLKVPHMRNLYEKAGPRYGDHVAPPPLVRSGFGFAHDGAVPDLTTFFSLDVFNLNEEGVRAIAAFSTHFPTGTRPAVGRQVTLPAGTPPTGPTDREDALATLIGLGDLASGVRHCELTATTVIAGEQRGFHLESGAWVPDVAGQATLTTSALREASAAPINFLCAPLDSGRRLGGDRDEDDVLNGDDCAPADPSSWGTPQDIGALDVTPTGISWEEQLVAVGPGLRYRIVGGLISSLSTSGLTVATTCLTGPQENAAFVDPRPDPPENDGYYYLVSADNSCATTGFGPGRQAIDELTCF